VPNRRRASDAEARSDKRSLAPERSPTNAAFWQDPLTAKPPGGNRDGFALSRVGAVGSTHGIVRVSNR